jgi:hypothetical protein
MDYICPAVKQTISGSPVFGPLSAVPERRSCLERPGFHFRLPGGWHIDSRRRVRVGAVAADHASFFRAVCRNKQRLLSVLVQY